MSRVLLIACIIVSVSTSTVKWLPNASFKLPENFKDGKLPCSKQTVVFPELIVGSIKLAATEVAGFVLPEEGELILDDLLTLGENPTDKDCANGNSYYVDKTASAWNQADVWSSSKFNDATPDSDRIPCFNDVVQFPQDAKITVALPKRTQHVKALYIGNHSYTSEQFRSRVINQADQRQQFYVNEFSTTGIEINTHMSCTRFGCPCQIAPMDIDCSSKFCPKTTCADPIKPLGFCCEICGGAVVFDPDKNFDMLAFNKFVEDYTGGNVLYHIGFAPELPVRRIQLVIVDKGGYEGYGPQIVNSINYHMYEHWFKGPKLMQISGSPSSKSGSGFKICISVFFVVALGMGAVYLYYYKVPQMRIPASYGGNIFARIRRTDSVVSLTRRDSVISTVRGATAFRNPMYDSRRGRVQVIDSAVEDAE